MTERQPTSDELAIRDLLSRVNAAWLERRFEDLDALFAEDMMLVAPGFAARLAGRKASVETFREFMNRAAVTSYLEDDLRVSIYGDTAIADYAWEMTWTDADQPHRQTGRDLFVFTRRQGEWRVVWRTLFPFGNSKWQDRK
jgi:uncharacterized protein (TIGR02246 family)